MRKERTISSRRQTPCRWGFSALLVAAGAALLASHDTLASLTGQHAFLTGTVALLAIGCVLPALWPSPSDASASRIRPARALLAGAAGLLVLVFATARLLEGVFAGPLDPNRGDMLVIIEHAITRFLAGQSPYAVHQVPWEAPLSYGPVLWLPYVVPHVLRTDLRILTLAAQLFVPVACFAAACLRAGRGDLGRAGLLFGLGTGAALHPEVMRFHVIGQTQVYWPLLLVFCLTLARSKWTTAAVCLGLIVAARSTMVSLVPVFLMYLRSQGALELRTVSALGLGAVLPFLPFVIADPAAVKYGMFDVYVHVMKGYVWQSTDWAVATYGLTGRLLEHGLERYVEIAQVCALAVTYTLAWRSVRAGSRPEPWLALALLVFSMTTLWPVIYLYFDVWVLLVCGLIGADGSLARSPDRSAAWSAGVIAALSLAVVLAVAAVRPGASYVLDIGAPGSAGFTGGGFGDDRPERDADRRFVWMEGPEARIRLPRAAWRAATITLSIRPHTPHDGLHQVVTATLNGRPLGRVRLADGWQEISFESRATQWRYGFNVLSLYFQYAVPADEAVAPQDRRELSAALDRVVIR